MVSTADLTKFSIGFVGPVKIVVKILVSILYFSKP